MRSVQAGGKNCCSGWASALSQQRCRQHLAHEGAAGIAIQPTRAGCADSLQAKH